MLNIREEAALVDDREDLIALLRMRFGPIPARMIVDIYGIDQLDTLQRLILVAANVDDYRQFVEELREGSGAYKLIGERLLPTGQGGETFA